MNPFEDAQSGVADGTLPFPYSLEAERAVLGCVMMDSGALGELAGLLWPAEFYDQKHRLIYGAMLALHKRDVLVDLRTLQAEMELRDELRLAGGLATLTALDLDLPDVGRLRAYADIVRERALRRQLISQAQVTIHDCLDGSRTPVQIAGELVTSVDSMITADGRGTEGFRPFAVSMATYMDHLENPQEIVGVRTGVEPLDRGLIAFEEGKLAIVAGRAGVGKTAAMIQMIAMEFIRGRSSGIVSLEMRDRDIVQRFIAHMLAMNSRDLASGHLTGQQWTQLLQLRREVDARNLLHIDDAPRQAFAQISARVRKLHRDHRVKSVFLDQISLVEREGARKSHEEVDELTYDLSKLAADLEISLVALMQLNRGPARENRPPQVADLRDGGEQAAWYVLLLHRALLPAQPEDGGDDEDTELTYSNLGTMNLGKNRSGSEFRVKAYYDGPRSQWWERKAWEVCAGRRGPLWIPQEQKWLEGMRP